MAERWCLIHGVLDLETAQKLDKAYGRIKISLQQPISVDSVKLKDETKGRVKKEPVKEEMKVKQEPESEDKPKKHARLTKEKSPPNARSKIPTPRNKTDKTDNKKRKRCLPSEEDADENIPLQAISDPLNLKMEEDSDAPLSMR